jgi:transcription initiation factor TFIID TATA-box-binding protein
LERNIAVVKPRIFVRNVVSTVYLGFKIDGKYILKHLKGSYITPKFAAIIYQGERSTALIFESGKLVITGCRTEDESLRESIFHIEKLRDIFIVDGIPTVDFGVITGKKCKIENVVANANASFHISLVSLCQGESTKCSYDPEGFAGLVYRMEHLNITLLIFANGNIVITGGDSVKKTEEAFSLIVPILEKYKTNKKLKI